MKQRGKAYTIRDIIQDTTWKQVKRAIEYHYPKDTNDYKKLYKQIKKYPKIKHKDKDEYIIVQVNQFFDVKDRWIGMHTNKYSMSFRPWIELANIPIGKETLDHILIEEIVAHFIWEITFYGSEQESMAVLERMHKQIDDVCLLEKGDSL